MKHGLAVLTAALSALCLIAVVPPDAAAQSTNYSYARIVRISYVEGDVQVLRTEEEGWQAALANLPIREGYSLATTQGRAEVEFENGVIARLAENTILQFNQLALADGARITQLTLQDGTASFYANLSGQDSFVVRTPYFDVNVPHQAQFRVDATSSDGDVSVFKGEVSVEARGTAYRVTKNHTLFFRVSDDQVTIARLAGRDAWDNWVSDRENSLVAARDASVSYTRAPVYYGMADLYSYGSWYDYGGYGRCWRPFGVASSWSPYWNGQWMFYNGIGWTWISNEPWGWLPYRYGAWVFSPALGWLWVPGGFNQWSPANVYWIRVGNGWGWGPMAPHDRPGQRPANLPNGTVTTANHTPPNAPPNFRQDSPRRLPYSHVVPGPDGQTRIVYEPPEDFEGGRIRRAGTQTPAGAAPAPGVAPAAVAPAVPSAPPSRSAGISRVMPPRGRLDKNTDASSGIVYDSSERRYVNSPNPQPAANAPAQAPAASIERAPAAGRLPVEQPAPSRDTPRQMERREREDRPAMIRPVNPPAPRSDAVAPQRQPSPPPRPADTARPTPPPRAEQPRPTPPPRVEPSRPSPPPRTERPPQQTRSESTSRSNSAPAPRSETRTSRPPHNHD